MVNLAYAVYDKQGNLLLGPVDTGALWSGFPIEDCTDPSGDPIVVYDQFADRWLLSQFTTRGTPYYYDCVAISQTADPTGSYYRYAFVTQEDADGLYYFPDYPEVRCLEGFVHPLHSDFRDAGGYGISVYALEKNKMINGQPKARAVQFFLNSTDVPLNLLGDGLLPVDVDGKTKPRNDAWAPIIGTQDDDYPYGATFDALNIWELNVLWNSSRSAAIRLPLSCRWPSSTRTSAAESLQHDAGSTATRDCLARRRHRRTVPRHPVLTPAPDVRLPSQLRRL